MKSLKENIFKLLIQGKTSLKEAIRVWLKDYVEV
jgi:hypothetical protein